MLLEERQNQGVELAVSMKSISRFMSNGRSTIVAISSMRSGLALLSLG